MIRSIRSLVRSISTVIATVQIWSELRTIDHAKEFAEKVGYPVLVRPSYVLSGAAMNRVNSASELAGYLSEAVSVRPMCRMHSAGAQTYRTTDNLQACNVPRRPPYSTHHGWPCASMRPCVCASVS
jgi:carbamoylphosphate synthase large subunit